jgi:hypothetical protein
MFFVHQPPRIIADPRDKFHVSRKIFFAGAAARANNTAGIKIPKIKEAGDAPTSFEVKGGFVLSI